MISSLDFCRRVGGALVVWVAFPALVSAALQSMSQKVFGCFFPPKKMENTPWQNPNNQVWHFSLLIGRMVAIFMLGLEIPVETWSENESKSNVLPPECFCQRLIDGYAPIHGERYFCKLELSWIVQPHLLLGLILCYLILSMREKALLHFALDFHVAFLSCFSTQRKAFCHPPNLVKGR